MRIIVVCISLALVACVSGQIKSYIDDYIRLFGVGSGGRWLRSAAGSGGNGVTGGFYLPASSRGNQANRGGRGSKFQVWNQGGDVSANAFSQPGPIGGASDFSIPVGGAGAGSYGPTTSSGSSGLSSNQGGSGGIGESNFQGYSANAGSVSNQGGSGTAGASNFQGWGNGAGNGGGGRNLPGSIGNPGSSSFQGYSVNTGSVSYQGESGGGGSSLSGPIGNTGGFQGYSRGPVRSNNQGGTRRAGGFRNQGGSGLGGYQNVPVGSQTSEGRNIDPQLLKQIRSILLQEEASSESGGRASTSPSSFSALSSSYEAPSTSFSEPSSAYRVPSTSYGAPSSAGSGGGRLGRAVGLVVEGIDQSIQIAQYHQTTSELDSSGSRYPVVFSAITSRSYGFPR